MGVKFKEKCKKCFHFQVCAAVLQNDLFIREVMLGEKDPECKAFVEVVRCKDCKYWDKRNFKNNGICLQKKNPIFFMTAPNFYCACGERREGE